MDKKDYKFGLDWLNGVLPVEDVSAVFDMLEVFSSKLRFNRWQLTNSGKYNYSRRYCLDGEASIQLMYNPVSEEELMTACKPVEYVSLTEYIKAAGTSNNPYVFFSISGDGIRKLHAMGGEVSALNKLLFYFYRHNFKASRFDTYCDILDKNNAIVPLIQEAFTMAGREQIGKPFIKTNFRRDRKNKETGEVSKAPERRNFQYWTKVDDDGNQFMNCQLGHHGSNIGMFRCYNKLIEVSDGRLADFSEKFFSQYDVNGYWYRLEYEMHKDSAAQCFNDLMSRSESCNTPLCFEDIFFACFKRVFSVGVANTTYQFNNGCHHIPDAWQQFGEFVSTNNIHFVQLGGRNRTRKNELVPYIDNSLERLDTNIDRVKAYVYQILLRLASLSRSERRRFLLDANKTFQDNMRYNRIRDRFDELPVKDLAHRVFDMVG